MAAPDIHKSPPKSDALSSHQLLLSALCLLWAPAKLLDLWVRLWSILHNVETIQVVLDSELLEATNGAAKRARVNRSSLIREALREYIKRLLCGRNRGSRSAGLPKASGRGGRRCGMGTGGIVAGEIGRGEVRLYRFPHPDKQRPVVVLTRDSAIGYLSAVTVAPITSTVRSVPSEVLLTEKDGMKATCAINLHNVVTVSKARLGRRVAMLSSERLREICAGPRFTLGCT